MHFYVTGFLRIMILHCMLIAPLLGMEKSISKPEKCLQAIYKADSMALEQELKENPQAMEYADENGNSLLFLTVFSSCIIGTAKPVQVILSFPSSRPLLNKLNSKGLTPLDRALIYDNEQTDLGFPPRGGVQKIITLLKKAGAKKSFYRTIPLITACLTGDLDQVRLLFRRAKVRVLIGEKAKYDPNESDQDGTTPLYAAAIHAHPLVVQELLKEGARILGKKKEELVFKIREYRQIMHQRTQFLEDPSPYFRDLARESQQQIQNFDEVLTLLETSPH